MKNSTRLITFAATVGLLVAGPVLAASIRVSSGGTDAPGCGIGPIPPCATIQQAVTNSANGDTVLVGPGMYGGGVINIDKALRLSSANGTGSAVVVAQVVLSADDIVFGKLGKGFSLSPGSGNPAIVATANAITVRGNLISDCATGVDVLGGDAVVRDNSFDSCSTGIRIAGSGAQVRGNRMGYINSHGVYLDPASSDADVRENRMFGPSGVGVAVGGSGHIARRNLIHGTPGGGFTIAGSSTGVQLVENVVVSVSAPAYYLSSGSGWVLRGNAAFNNGAPGFYLTAGTPLIAVGNVAIGNGAYGFLITGGDDHVLEDNTSIDNLGDGIVLSSVGNNVQFSGGNLYGNTSNCGLNHSSGSTLTVDGVYWGAATGPGANPADDICGNTAAVTVNDSATKPAKIKPPAVK